MLRPTPNKMPAPPLTCPLERCLGFLAGAWTPRVLWFLRAEPRRFGDLRRDLVGISAKTLTARLRELEELGVVQREVIPSSPPSVQYELTALGRRFQPVLDAMIVVGKELAGESRAGSLPRRYG
jgi:DNA-binding HxlR family transcriptional regulator